MSRNSQVPPTLINIPNSVATALSVLPTHSQSSLQEHWPCQFQPQLQVTLGKNLSAQGLSFPICKMKELGKGCLATPGL